MRFRGGALGALVILPFFPAIRVTQLGSKIGTSILCMYLNRDPWGLSQTSFSVRSMNKAPYLACYNAIQLYFWFLFITVIFALLFLHLSQSQSQVRIPWHAIKNLCLVGCRYIFTHTYTYQCFLSWDILVFLAQHGLHDSVTLVLYQALYTGLCSDLLYPN